MKFNCVKSNTTLAGHKALFGMLRNAPKDRNAIFIVPDRYTLGIEKAICEEAYPDGYFNVDVVTFTRLAKKALGPLNKATLSKEGTVLLMNRVIEKCNDELGYYKNVGSMAFSREMFATVASLRSSNVTPEDIERQLPSMQGSTKEKLKDIAVIYRAYVKALLNEYFDTVTRVDWLESNLSDVKFITDSDIYVLGFNVFSNQQLKLIKKMLLLCRSVNVAFAYGSSKGSNYFLFPNRQCDLLVDFCNENGIKTEVLETYEKLAFPFDYLNRELFGFSMEKAAASTDKVRVFGADNAYAEIKSVAKEISHLVFERGLRYKDIAVVCSGDDYAEIIKTVFARYDIPLFVDEKYFVKNGFLANFVFSAFDAVTSNYERSKILDLIRSPYFDFSREETQTFENFCIKFNINHTLNVKNIDDYGLTDDEKAAITRIFATLYQTLSQIPFRGKTSTYCQTVALFGSKPLDKEFSDNESAAIRLYSDPDPLLEVIEEIESLTGEKETDASSFTLMLSSVIENMTVSVVPQFLDCVFVGDVSDSRFSDVKALFVVGANEGNFPKTSGDRLILGSYDTEIMRKNGLEIFPNAVENNRFAEFEVIDLIAKPDVLYVTYALSNVAGVALNESSGVKELKYRLNLVDKDFIEYYDFTEEEALLYNLVNEKNAYYEYVSGKVPLEYRDATKSFLLSAGYLKAETACEELPVLTDYYDKTPDGAVKISVSKMERYFKCPFENFLTNVLKLKEREIGELRVNDKGSVIHRVLEKYFSARESLREMTEEKREKRAAIIIDEVFSLPEYARYYDDAIERSEMTALKKECGEVLKTLTKMTLDSSFTPAFLEYYFGNNSEITVTVGGKKYVFKGVIDRVDVSKDNEIIVIDYKTGRIEPSLKSVYVGEKIQLYLYLKYFLDKGYKPVGVFYLPITSGYKKGGASFAMQGQMLDDLIAFGKIDNNFFAHQNESFKSLNVKFDTTCTKSGVKFGRTGAQNRIQESDFYRIAEYVTALCAQAIEDISSGDLEKNPIQGGCKYCMYKRICGDVTPRADVNASIESFYFETEENGERRERTEGVTK